MHIEQDLRNKSWMGRSQDTQGQLRVSSQPKHAGYYKLLVPGEDQSWKYDINMTTCH